MPGPNKIITVKGSFELSNLCDKEFHKMAQNFGMMANYGEPKDKAKKRDYRSHNTTRRTSSGTRSEEIVGTAIRPRGNYRRRGKNLGNIDSRNTRIEQENKAIKATSYPRAMPSRSRTRVTGRISWDTPCILHYKQKKRQGSSYLSLRVL
jgi:hypothetical protein